MQLPSNKVGLVLVSVVLVIASTIFFSKYTVPVQKIDLKNVDLIVTRDTDPNFKTGDDDKDGLLDWQEELWGTDKNNADTDGDGTNDGDEIAQTRDPRTKGPDDPLRTRESLIAKSINTEGFATGTLSDRVSVDLFTQYLNLKKEGDFNVDTQAQLVDSISKQVIEGTQIVDNFSASDLQIINASKDTLKVYGEDFSQIAVSYLKQIDAYRSLPNNQYFFKLAIEYKNFATALSQIQVPDVAKDVHLQIINQIYKTGLILDILNAENTDPMKSIVAIRTYEASQRGEGQLYTTLALYFKNNGIIFDNTVAINFWNYFAQ